MLCMLARWWHFPVYIFQLACRPSRIRLNSLGCPIGVPLHPGLYSYFFTHLFSGTCWPWKTDMLLFVSVYLHNLLIKSSPSFLSKWKPHPSPHIKAYVRFTSFSTENKNLPWNMLCPGLDTLFSQSFTLIFLFPCYETKCSMVPKT